MEKKHTFSLCYFIGLLIFVFGSPPLFYPDTDGSWELTCKQYNCKTTNRKEVHCEKSIADR